MMTSQMLRVNEVAKQLNVSVRYVWGLVARREISVHRFGKSVRISMDDLQRFIELSRQA